MKKRTILTILVLVVFLGLFLLSFFNNPPTDSPMEEHSALDYTPLAG